MTVMPAAPFSHPKILLRCLLAILFAATVSAAARADVTDAMREIERKGYARVIVRMNADNGADNWTPTAPAERQRVAVAAARVNIDADFHRAGITNARGFRTLPFVTATVSRCCYALSSMANAL